MLIRPWRGVGKGVGRGGSAELEKFELCLKREFFRQRLAMDVA